MNTLPASLVERIGKMVGQLGSDQEGIIVAAARAIQRTLSSAGHDLNDLAEHIAAPSKIAAVYRNSPPDPQTPHRAQVTRCQRAGAGRLSPWEVKFLNDIAQRLDVGLELSVKQAATLVKISAKVEART